MLKLEWIRAKRNLGRALLANGALVLSIATGDWCHFTPGPLYVFS